jgi:5,5'-dehydrodivanillate O-demethylase
VPIDDDHTLSVGWFIDGIPGDKPFEQERIPYWYAPVRDQATGRWVTSHVMNQDFVAWAGQGAIADRWNEHLGESDRGIIMVRRRFMDDIKTVQDGGDPKGIVRDSARNEGRLHLPIVSRPPRPVQSKPHPFPFLTGQPVEIWNEMQEVWAKHAT